jgi:hypothetical protein
VPSASNSTQPEDSTLALLSTTAPTLQGHGPVQISVPGTPSILDPLVLKASNELGYPYKFTLDLNAGDSVGFSKDPSNDMFSKRILTELLGLMQNSIGSNGHRSSAFTAYLAPLMESRSNLYVLINTQVTKLSPSSDSAHDLRTVNVAQVHSGKTIFEFSITSADKFSLFLL